MNGSRSTRDEASFARLYDETSARVYGLVLRVVRDPAMAEQVTRDVYLHAWAQSGRDETSTASVSSLMTVAHRQAVEVARSSATVEVAVVPAADAVRHPFPASCERARRALDHLPAAERQAVELAYFDGHTHTEVSLLVGGRPDSAKALIRDGLGRLSRTLLEPV